MYETVYKTGFRDNLDDPTFYDFENDEERPAILFLKFRKAKNMKVKSVKEQQPMPTLSISFLKKTKNSKNKIKN